MLLCHGSSSHAGNVRTLFNPTLLILQLMFGWDVGAISHVENAGEDYESTDS